MAKVKNPFLSLSALGAMGKDLVIRGRGKARIVERKPIPTDARSAAQLAWRPMFTACKTLWHDLSALEKQDWESQARSRHMTGYAWFMSQCLRPNPGIYLPLAGGTMQGDINMDSHKIFSLPTPSAASEAATKGYVDGVASLGDYPMNIKPNIERWVIPGWLSSYHATASITADRIYYIPIFVPETTTYIRMGILVTTSDTGTAHLRIYEWNNGVPGDLILDVGTVDVSSTGAKEKTISQELTRGYYFLAIRCNCAPTLRGPSPTYAIVSPVQGISTYGSPEIKNPIAYVDAAFADPAPAPTGVLTANYATTVLREN